LEEDKKKLEENKKKIKRNRKKVLRMRMEKQIKFYSNAKGKGQALVPF
jgi:hypothetical protein